VAGEFNFTDAEQKIFSEGVEAFSAAHAMALAATYDFSRHRHLLDLGGGTGSFLLPLMQRYPNCNARYWSCLAPLQSRAKGWPETR